MKENETVTLLGKAVYILFRNSSTYYTVLRFKLSEDSEKTLTVTGLFPEIETNILYRISGHYKEHPRYGMQFEMESYEKPLPGEREGIIRFLSGVQFPGIGKKTAAIIADALGDECLDMIRQDPHVLRTIPQLSPEKADVIIKGMEMNDEGISELVRFLNVHGIGMRNLVRLNRAYGKEALEKLRANPYRVIEECDGFGFKLADQIAMSLGFSKTDDRRLYAFLISLCMDLCVSKGDSYVDVEELRAVFEKKTLEVETDFDELLERALFAGKLVREEERIYPETQYEAENGIASFLAGFPFVREEPYDSDHLEKCLGQLEERIGITYDKGQVKAIQTLFEYPFTILTGGPGTGKTTVVRAMTSLYRTLYPGSKVICAAPTGRAAKRLAELTETEASTIHSLLRWDLETNTFGVDEDEPLSADLLIIDEFSMVDTWLLYNLLKASRQIRKICLIGDEDQLPSVGPGSALRDLIASDCFPLIRLKHIYRQKEGSGVIQLAHRISGGDPDLSGLSDDVSFLPCDRSEIKDLVLETVAKAVLDGYQMNDIQVLSAMYGGAGGIDVLNNALQAAFNPQDGTKREYRSGYVTFRTGDKVLQLKNQPDDDVYNGDIGILEEILEASETADKTPVLVVNFDENYVEYTPETIPNITLAYCISVHKAQGSEYPAVIMPMSGQQAILLQRKLIYTGVTRARRRLVLIGEQNAFEKGVEVSERHVRKTGLKDKIIATHRQKL